MYIQGDLQSVFDALFNMGVIDPVLEADWSQAMDKWSEAYPDYKEAVEVVNKHQGQVEDLVENLESFDTTTLNYLAMEVARELANYHTRENVH